MTQEQIIEGDKIIAEFMGRTNLKDSHPDLIKKDLWTDGLFDETKSLFDPFHKKSPLDNTYAVVEHLQYHSSWDWLMAVVEKIEKMFNYEKDKPFFSVEGFTINWSRSYPSFTSRTRISICTKLNGSSSEFHNISTESKSKIESVWLGVVEFIKFYNQNKQP